MEQPEPFNVKKPKPPRKKKPPQEFKLVAVRDCAVPDRLKINDSPVILVRRTLKIEAHGDPWKGPLKPKIRIMGRWLERAGFKPGNRVQVASLAPGVIELRSPNPLPSDKTKSAPAGQPDRTL